MQRRSKSKRIAQKRTIYARLPACFKRESDTIAKPVANYEERPRNNSSQGRMQSILNATEWY
jgi:hypothetical protein